MDNWVDNARIASGQDQPMSLQEALQRGTDGKVLARVLPTVERAEIWFDATVSMLVAQGLIVKMRGMRAYLKGGGELVAVTEHQAQGAALRGISMVWLS